MPPLTMLIKPASGNCNMNCKYCFYADEVKTREISNRGIMKLDLLEVIIFKALHYAEKSCCISFQGGEPTLAGLDYFKNVINFQNKYNEKNIKIYNSIQTNGYSLNEEWADFFKKNEFTVGLSLDGNKKTHDRYRTDIFNCGTFEKVMNTAKLFDSKKVEYNVLTVITPNIVENIGKIYNFYKSHQMFFQQYIPCLDSLYSERGSELYSLTPEAYENFLKRLFDLWYLDITNGKYVYIRYFDNILKILKGLQPEQCGASGVCSIQMVVEADGSVYPCDFYMTDDYYLGNLRVDTFEIINEKRKELKFIEDSFKLPEKCKKCKWLCLCRNGCKRDRIITDNNADINYYCKAYYNFFEYSMERFVLLK